MNSGRESANAKILRSLTGNFRRTTKSRFRIMTRWRYWKNASWRLHPIGTRLAITTNQLDDFRWLLDYAICSNNVPRETLLEKIALFRAWQTPSGARAPVRKWCAKPKVLLAPLWVQKRWMSSLFCGVAQNFFKLYKSLRQCESEVKNRRGPRAILPAKLARVKCYLQICAK